MEPSGSDEPVASTVTSRPTICVLYAATGASFAPGATTCAASWSVAPSSSVTVNVTVYVPSAKTWFAVALAPDTTGLPSPKFHE